MFPQLFEGSSPSETRFEMIRNRQGHKPLGGLWTCDFLGPPNYSEWVQWCLNENFKGPEFDLWLLYPRTDVRVLTVDDIKTFNDLPADPLWKETPHVQFINFEALAVEWDGIKLTDSLIHDFRLEWNFRYHTTLYAWDVESTLWFRWVFDSVESLGRKII